MLTNIKTQIKAKSMILESILTLEQFNSTKYIYEEEVE